MKIKNLSIVLSIFVILMMTDFIMTEIKNEPLTKQTEAQYEDVPTNISCDLPNISFPEYKWLPFSVVVKNFTENNLSYSPQFIMAVYAPNEVEIGKEYNISVYIMRVKNISNGETVMIGNTSLHPIFTEFNTSKWLKICLGIGVYFPTFQKYVHIGIGLFSQWDIWVYHILIGEGCNVSLDYYYKNQLNYSSPLEIPYMQWSQPQIVYFKVKRIVYPNISFVKDSINNRLIVSKVEGNISWSNLSIWCYNASEIARINLSGKIEAGDEIIVNQSGLYGNVTISINWIPTNLSLWKYNFTIIRPAPTILYVENITSPQNQEIMAPIFIGGYDGWVWGANLTLYYNNSVVSVEDVSIPDYWVWKWYKIDNENGTVKIFASLNDSTFPLRGKIIFANITFKAIGNIGSFSPLHLEINEYNGEPSPKVIDGVFKILSVLRVIPSFVCIPSNFSRSFNVTLERLPTGLSGYNITITPVLWINATSPYIWIENVTFPAWAMLHEWGKMPLNSIWLKAVDLNNYITANQTNVTLATITIKTKAPYTGIINGSIFLAVNRLDDDNGYPIDVITQNASITVFPPLPNHTAPTDPNGDGLYEDINGNGKMDFDDVVKFFWHFEWMEKHWPTAAVDFNRNGLMDYDDIVELFKEI